MSKRGRRRNSRRRKSSSSSKQSVSPYIFQKQNKSNSICYKDDVVEKGETDCLRKESILSVSEDEEKYNSAPPKEKRFKQDYHINSFPHQRSIYTKTTEDEENGVKIVTSVSVSDTKDSSPNILFQQSHEPLSENTSHSSKPVTNILKINCTGSHVRLEIQEMLQRDVSGIKTTFVFMNENRSNSEMLFNGKCERTSMSNNESSEKSSQNVSDHCGHPNSNYTFTFGSMSEQTKACNDSKSISSTDMWDNQNCCQCCSAHKQRQSAANHPFNPSLLVNVSPQEKRKCFYKSSSCDHCDIPPPQEFADIKCNTLEDLTHDLASCRIDTYSPADKQQREFYQTYSEESKCPQEEERADLAYPFDQLSESDNYEPMFMRPSLSTNRSSFTKDFISCQKRKSWIRNNSIGTVEHRACSLPKKRRQTFPGMSQGLGLMQEDFLLPSSESFSSLVMCSLPFQTERMGRIHQGDAFGIGSHISSQIKGSSQAVSEISDRHDGKQTLLSPFYVTSSEENPDDVFAVSEQYRRRSSNKQQDTELIGRVCKDMESLDTDECEYKVDQSEVADSGFDQEMGDVEYHSPEPLKHELSRRTLAIQVIPPSCSGSEEQLQPGQKEAVSVFPVNRKSSVMTITVGALEQRFLQMDSRSSLGSCMEKDRNGSEDSCNSPLQESDASSLNTNDVPEENDSKPTAEQTGSRSLSLPQGADHLQLHPGNVGTDDSNKPASCPAKGCTDTQTKAKELLSKPIPSRSSLEGKEHLKPVAPKDQESCGSDHWAKRRTLFKESKQWSSAGGSSITSDITEESVSEDTRSMDVTVQDNEDRGFYTETFHSSAWIYQGDDVVSGAICPGLTNRTRAVSIRERTVKISKGTGEYPWGFRIQFSKPIVVTEVDTSPDVLTLTIGSDIARAPNTPRPACRGYLHKRTQSGLIKGWRKRWFVLTHDCCLYYYRHKRDEGKRRALSAVKLEGAEVGPDLSLGKPFVFKCCPQSGSRMYFFCATSNQEMKRWLEAMEKAIHPVTQNHVWVDVTRHNSNLPPLAVKNPDCLGLLHKMDKSKDTWVQNYCILKDSCLYLYSGIRATHAHGGIYLQGYMVREQSYGPKKSTIELKPPSDEFKTFYFCAENPNENKRWIAAIKASINKWLLLHQALQDYMNCPSEETRM
ncbi:uncharacterized protein pdzph1 isoform X2 [Mugil cephalus]|uniref:uncharacterized protein pdzph1 isoform X2 n=1 Tax=Mugil cephalus TaxID=48193 RepID=UPI001FB82D6C|nr:uncharacterized protein pdzph1 isoform X2 [Mugil cephalus]